MASDAGSPRPRGRTAVPAPGLAPSWDPGTAASGRRRFALLVASLLLTACASTGSFHVAYEAGHPERAAEIFAADSTLHTDEEALYHMGLLRAEPGSALYDPAGARELFERLLRLHPETEHRPAVARILVLLDQVTELSRQLRELKAIDLRAPPRDTTDQP